MGERDHELYKPKGQVILRVKLRALDHRGGLALPLAVSFPNSRACAAT